MDPELAIKVAQAYEQIRLAAEQVISADPGEEEWGALSRALDAYDRLEAKYLETA